MGSGRQAQLSTEGVEKSAGYCESGAKSYGIFKRISILPQI